MVDYYCYLDSQVTKKDYQNKLSNANQKNELWEINIMGLDLNKFTVKAQEH